MEDVPVNLLSIQWWVYYFLTEYRKEPGHVLIELICIIIIVYLFFSKSYDPKKLKGLSKAEEDELIEEWQPEPLCTQSFEDVDFLVVDSGSGAKVVVEGREMINLASFDFAGLADSPEVKEAARGAIEKYGVGSCGPRGFYGTIDVHLAFEKAVAEFMAVEESILYSDSLACVASVIPSFAKRGDLIICDEGIAFSAQQGMMLSRSNVLFYKHNDMEDLERILDEVAAKTLAKKKKDDLKHRKFIVTEGIFQYHGDIAPLATIVELKKKHQFRLILDDSFAFGVLGSMGRGSPEHFNIPIEDIDMYCITADTALGTTGGFCMGDAVVVDHQRLSGAGYCFSASSPPFSSAAGVCNIGILKREPQRCEQVRQKAARLRKALRGIDGIDIKGEDICPVIHLRLKRSLGSEEQDVRLLHAVQKYMRQEGVIVDVPAYVPAERHAPPPSVRVTVTAKHEGKDLDQAAALLAMAFAHAYKQKY